MPGISSTNLMTIYEDPTKKITIDQIRKQAFKFETKKITTYGASSSTWWIRLQVHNSQAENLTWSIKFLFGLFDNMEMWQYSGEKLLSHDIKGDHHIDPKITPFNERTVFTFDTKANEYNTIYFKIFHNQVGVIELFNTIWTQDELKVNLEIYNLLVVSICTALFVLLFYNLFIYFVLNNKVYFWYILYLVGLMIILITFNQVGSHFIWNNWFFIEDNMPFIGFVLTNVSFLMFTRIFLETKQRLKRVDTFLVILIILEFLGLFFALIDYRLQAIQLISLIAFSFCFFPLFGLYLWKKKGFIIARGYTLATLILSITATITILRFTEFLPTNEVIFWIGRFGFVLEGILLSIVLADRLNIIENSYKKVQEQITHKLESQVKQRTFELEEAIKCAERLARKDVLTGIWNRRAFIEMSEKLILDSKRHNIPLSIIMIDIDHFKSVNDKYGHEGGDIVLREFSKNIDQQTRENDIFARIGGEEFVMVLPHTHFINATQKAESLRKCIEERAINIEEKTLNITASMGVAEFNAEEDSLDTLLARADKAMYYIKSHGRNGVYCSK